MTFISAKQSVCVAMTSMQADVWQLTAYIYDMINKKETDLSTPRKYNIYVYLYKQFTNTPLYSLSQMIVDR